MRLNTARARSACRPTCTVGIEVVPLVKGRPHTPGERYFWTLAAPLLEQPGVTRSTMMGFACLRLDGGFFATCDYRTGYLVVKLDEASVTNLVDRAIAEAVRARR